MEQELITSFTSLGIVGVIGLVLFKKFINDSESDKAYFRNELKISRDIYQEELQKDREIYIASIDKITSRIDNIENDVKDIKETLRG